jgi:quercetin dioxygenase-like cupin family protein
MLLGAGSLALCGCSVADSGIAAVAPHPASARAAAEPQIVRIGDVASPESGRVTDKTFVNGANMVARLMRLAPGATIAEHHHPHFEETFVVQRGEVELMLNNVSHRVGAGEVVYMPAGTAIAGRNSGAAEAVVVVTWARNGEPGPLTVSGAPGAPH